MIREWKLLVESQLEWKIAVKSTYKNIINLLWYQLWESLYNFHLCNECLVWGEDSSIQNFVIEHYGLCLNRFVMNLSLLIYYHQELWALLFGKDWFGFVGCNYFSARDRVYMAASIFVGEEPPTHRRLFKCPYLLRLEGQTCMDSWDVWVIHKVSAIDQLVTLDLGKKPNVCTKGQIWKHLFYQEASLWKKKKC